MTLLLLACFGGAPTGETGRETGDDTADSHDTADTADSETADSGDSGTPWVDPLDPDDVHILVGSTPGEGSGWGALEELGADFSDRWTLAFDDDAGTAGAIRHPDGSTTYARTWPPPALGSAIETVDAQGALLDSVNSFFARVSFVHGLVETPAGDWVIADTLAGRVISVDTAGTVLWELTWSGIWPNGVAITTDDEGVTRIVVTFLYQSGSDTTDRIDVWRLGGRTEEPTREWTWPADGDDATGTWPHGPHFLPDGTVTAMLAGRGQLIGLREGEEVWRIPEEPGAMAFARDAVFLPDGSLVVADAAAEVLRVADPFGSFTVVDSRRAPGVYCVEALDCATEACLP